MGDHVMVKLRRRLAEGLARIDRDRMLCRVDELGVIELEHDFIRLSQVATRPALADGGKA